MVLKRLNVYWFARKALLVVTWRIPVFTKCLGLWLTEGH